MRFRLALGVDLVKGHVLSAKPLQCSPSAGTLDDHAESLHTSLSISR